MSIDNRLDIHAIIVYDDCMKDTCIKKAGPVYTPLLDEIRQNIRTGKVLPGQTIGTEVGLAAATGISRVSVRRAVDRLIDEGLVIRRAGKGIFVSKPESISTRVQVVLANMELDIHLGVFRGVQRFGQINGTHVQVYDAHSNVDADIEFIRQLPNTPSDGAIIVAIHTPRFAKALFDLKASGFPMVLVDQRLSSLEVPSVLTDNYRGGFLLGKELIALGHRRVGVIGDLLNAHTIRDRLQGLQDAFIDARLPFDRSLVLDLEITDILSPSTEPVERGVHRLMERSDRPTAIFCTNDINAMRTYAPLKALGLRVPQDVSVVGFDDLPFCPYLDPPLSTVRQPFEEMGRIALEMLLKRIEIKKRGEKEMGAEYRLLTPMWVPRGSTAPPPVLDCFPTLQ